MRSTALLWLRARGFRNQFAARKASTIGRLAILAMLAVCWSLATAGGVGVTLSGVMDAAAGRSDLQTVAIALAAGAILVLVLFVDNGTAASLLTADVDRLLVTPVPPRAIVRAKLVANLPVSVLVLVPGMTAIALVVGHASGRWGAALFVAGVACVAAGVLTACCAGVVAITCARLLPRRRAVVALESGAWLTASIFGFALLWGGGTTGLERLLALARTGAGWEARAALWMPGGWIARAFTAAARGETLATVGALGFLVLASAGAFLLAQESGAALYRAGWSARETQVRATRMHATAAPRWARTGVGAMLRKEWLLMRRTQAMVMGLAVFGAYFAVSSLSLHNHGVAGTIVRFAAMWAGYDIGTRSLALDRQAFWRLRTAPVAARTIALAKLLAALAIAVPFTAVCGAVSALVRGASPSDTLVVLVECAIVSVPGVALGLLVGAFFTNFAWTRRGTMLRSPGAWMFLPVLVVALTIGTLLGRLPLRTHAAGLVVTLAAAILCVALVLPLVARRIDRIEWSRSE